MSLKEFNIDIQNKLLLEKNGDNKIFLPAIMLTQNEIKISDTLSETFDTITALTKHPNIQAAA